MAGTERNWYVLALADPGSPSTFRVLGRTLHTVSLGPGIVAIAKRGAGRVEPTSEALQEQHEIVAGLAARLGGLLPARFGSLVDERALRALASGRRREILEALAAVRGRCQMTIRVFGPPERALRGPDRRLTGTAFLASRRARARRTPPEVDIIRGTLGSLAVAERVEPGEGGLRVTVYHLVSTEDVQAYVKQAGHLGLEPHRVVLSGPWPPFAFAPELF